MGFNVIFFVAVPCVATGKIGALPYCCVGAVKQQTSCRSGSAGWLQNFTGSWPWPPLPLGTTANQIFDGGETGWNAT